jgi:hypothetical protein
VALLSPSWRVAQICRGAPSPGVAITSNTQLGKILGMIRFPMRVSMGFATRTGSPSVSAPRRSSRPELTARRRRAVPYVLRDAGARKLLGTCLHEPSPREGAVSVRFLIRRPA